MIVVCLLAIFGLAFGTTVFGSPKPCCTSEQYRLFVTEGSEFNSGSMIFRQMFFDAKKSKIAYEVFQTDPYGGGQKFVHRIVEDYNKHKRYTIEKSGICSSIPFNVPFVGNCIPANAQYLGYSYTGMKETPESTFDSWRFLLKGVSWNITLTMYREGCVPAFEAINGNAGGHPLRMNFYFNGFQDGIPDFGPFNVPPSC